MFRMPLIAAIVALFSAPLAAQSLEDPVTTFTLDNGMQVVVVEDHRAPVVQHMLWYRAGAADEPKGSSGVAHFLEHLLFKATDKMESGEFSATVTANGGRDNAFTSHDYTAYYQRVAADRLELMMSMEADRMHNIRLTPEDVLTERDVIIEERNQRTENSPQALFREQLMAAQYLNHNYGSPIIGWLHEMQELTRDKALAFYKTFYAPNNTILVVSGDVSPDEVRQLAEKYYGVIPANPDLPVRERVREPAQIAERRVIMRDARVAQPYVQRSYLAPERDAGAQETAAALTMLANILGGGTTSYMAEKLQFDSKVATYSAAYYSAVSLDATTFDLIVVPVDGVTLEEAEAALDATIAGFLKDGVKSEDLARLKKQVRANEIYSRDNVDRIADLYGRGLSSGLTVADVQAWPDLLEAVTEDDIMAAARQVFNRKQSVTGWLLKENEGAE